MKKQSLILIVLGLWVVTPAFSKAIQKKSKRHGTKLVLNRPEDFGVEDKFYRNYFGKVDQSIEQVYQQNWRFHELQVKYEPAFQKDVHYTQGTSESYAQGKKESEMRNTFAEQVVRMRIDSAVRTYFSDKKGSLAKKAIDTVDNLRDMRVKAPSSEGGKQAEFSFGYDVMTDASHLEYVKGNIEAGLYHQKLTGAFMGRAQLVDADLRVWTNMDGTVPRTTVSVPVSANTFTTSVSQPLAQNVMGTVATSQPLKDVNANHSYDVSVAFTF